MSKKIFFITGTDTGVGKTIATFVLAVLLKAKGNDTGVMKPVQCSGHDAAFLKKALGIGDSLAVINPCYARQALSPHLAFRRENGKVDLAKIKRAFVLLRERHDILLVEGAGGLMVPLKDGYYNADLIRDLDAEVVIVSRLGLGAINHALLTINQARAYGLKIKGMLFSDARQDKKGIAERTNPVEINRLSGVRILGTIPYLKTINIKEVLKKCSHISVV